jgi:hypothetical protein
MNRWQRFTSATILAWAAIAGGAGSAAAHTKPEGEMRFALYVTVAPAWLDPAEAGRVSVRHSGSYTGCATRW